MKTSRTSLLTQWEEYSSVIQVTAGGKNPGDQLHPATLVGPRDQ